jgi:MYXO-CTERM domain-containing protein
LASKSTWVVILASFAAAGGGGACGRGIEGDRSAGRSGPIIGGTADTTHDAVLALIQFETPTRGFACTGTTIAQSGTSAFLLTAAHCVLQHDAMDQVIQPMTIASPSMLTVVQGPDWQASLALGHNFSVAAVSVAAGYDGATESPNDVAVVRFVTSTPSLPVIPILEAADDTLAVGSTLTLVGYGETTVGDPTNSTRQTLDRPIDNLDAQHIFYLQNDMKGGCSGDSGGPALTRVGGAERVAGVFSYTVDLPSINLFCSLQSASVRVSSLASFIHSIAGGGSPPDAGRPDAGLFPDGSQTPDATSSDGHAADAGGSDAAYRLDSATADGARPGSDGPGPESPPAADAGSAQLDAASAPDARTDGSADGQEERRKESSGCSCVVSGRSGSTWTWGWLAGIAALLRARRFSRQNRRCK